MDRRSTRADLASVASTLDELTRRVEAAAGGLDDEEDSQAMADLYEVERALRSATRRMQALVRRLG